MENRKLRMGALILLLVFSMAAQASAFWWVKKEPPPKEQMKPISKRLELSKEQEDKFKKQTEDMQKELKPQREQVKKIGDELKTELEKDAPDRTRVHNQIREISRIRTEMQLKRMDTLLDLRKSLTPEQKKRFKTMAHPKERRINRARDHRGRDKKRR